MSHMTDAEFLRHVGIATDPFIGRNARLNAIADRLDAMAWRKEPPDTGGSWVRAVWREDGHRWSYYVYTLEADLRTSYTGEAPERDPGYLWLKLPPREVPR